MEIKIKIPISNPLTEKRTKEIIEQIAKLNFTDLELLNEIASNEKYLNAIKKNKQELIFLSKTFG